MNATQRTAVYGIALAVIALLVGYDVLADDKAPLWIALVSAVLAAAAPVTALRHVTPDADPADDSEDMGH